MGKKNKKSEETVESIIQEEITEKSLENIEKEGKNKQIKGDKNSEKEDKKDESFTGEVKDFLKDLVIIVLIVLFIRTFFVMPFQINGQSMYSSFYDKEFIIVDRLSYRLSEPERGDVIVFKPNVSQIKEFYLKRIIGLPGETIRIENGQVSVKKVNADSFEILDEKYLNEENKGNTYVGGLTDKREYIVPNGEYMVLGDNRNHSTDSRECFASCSYPGATNFARKTDLIGKILIDLGYFNYRTFSFIHPTLGINTTPKFLNSPKNYDY